MQKTSTQKLSVSVKSSIQPKNDQSNDDSYASDDRTPSENNETSNDASSQNAVNTSEDQSEPAKVTLGHFKTKTHSHKKIHC